MGTNYYLVYDECKCCGRSENVHLGKSSGGWQFIFHPIEIPLQKVDPVHILANSEETIRVDTFQKLKNFLQAYIKEYSTVRIKDEYSQDVTFEDFIEMVQSKKGLNHYEEGLKQKWGSEHDYLDPEGYCFSDVEFC